MAPSGKSYKRMGIVLIYRPNRALKTGEIAFINDIFAPTIEVIETHKKEHLLLEVCNFIHIDDATSKIIKKFQSTFMSALEYIKKDFDERATKQIH